MCIRDSVHAWACALGVELRLRAFTSVEAYMAANEPMTTDLVLGLDLDPSSADDFRLLVAQSLTPRGFVVAGLQMTEDGSDAHGEVDEVAESLVAEAEYFGWDRPRTEAEAAAGIIPPGGPVDDTPCIDMNSECERWAAADECTKNAGFMRVKCKNCLLYTSPSPRDGLLSRMPSSA